MPEQQNKNIPSIFNERQKKILRTLQWIIYPLFILYVAAEVLPEFVPSIKGKFDIVKTVFGLIGKAVFILFALVFSWLLLGFILHEISKNRKPKHYEHVIIELKHKKSILSLLVVLVALGFSIFMNFILFNPGVILHEENLQSTSFIEKGIFSFFYILVHFLLVVFSIRAVRNPAYFILTNEGFFYEPADVSVGFILWKDIAAIKEDRLIANRGGFAGPTTNPVLVLSFKDPEKYNKQYNFILRKFVELATKLIKYQTGGVGDVVIDPIYFGNRYTEIKELMVKHFEMKK